MKLKTNNNKKVIFLFAALVIASIYVIPLINNNFGIWEKETILENEIDNRLKEAGFWNLTGILIEIDDSDPTKNWSYTAATYGWCSGSGTWDDPYILEDILIDGQNMGRSIEIRNSNKPFIIKNSTIYNSGSGSYISAIALNNTSNGFLVNNDISNNNGVGIFLYNDCHNNTISNSTVNNNGGHGIFLRTNCYNNTISDNAVNDNDNRGIYLHTNCTNNIISGNTAGHEMDYDTDHGIHLHFGCKYNIITGNTVIDTIGDGIWLLVDCDNNIISNNTATDNYPSGICIQELSDNNIITENIANGGKFQTHGIYINAMCNNNTISNNFVKDNYGSGILLEYYCYNNTISGNIVSSTSEYITYVHGIELYYDCDNNIIEGNNASNNNDNGIFLRSGSDNNIVIGNIANDNTNGYGIRSGNCDNTNISGNFANGNFGHGMYLSNCHNNNISGNIANDNIGYGIYLSNCDNNRISANNASDNNNHGISLNDCDNNNISGNFARSNNDIGINLLTNCDNNNLTGNYVYFNTNGAIDIVTTDCNDTKVKGNVLVSNDEKFFNDNGTNTVSSLNYYLPTIPSLRVEILDQSFSTTEFIYIINISSGLGLEPWVLSIHLWWNGINVSSNNIIELGNGLFNISLIPIFVEPGQDPILFNMTITSANHRETYFETYIAVEPSDIVKILQVEIIGTFYALEYFNLTIFVFNEIGQGIDLATIQLWWNGTDVSTDVRNLGNGLYFVSLTPITVAPGADPILLNMIISVSGYEDKYFETYIGVDPDTLQKGERIPSEELPLALIITISTVSAGVIIGVAGIFWFRRRKKIV